MKQIKRAMMPVAAVLMLSVAGPVRAQSTGPSHAGYDPNAPLGAHVHEGELGEKLMIIESSLKCNCSCGLDVHSCQFQMQCGVSPGWTQRIIASLEAGESVEAIQAGFVADYGGPVLMMPPAEGFNLLGYLLPAMAMVTAGMLIGMIARGRETGMALEPVTELSDGDAERLRAAMKKLDESESPDW